MQSRISNRSSENPLSDLISDDIYRLLKEKGLLHETSIRDRIIRKSFKKLRSQKMSVGDAIEILREDYPYLQFETIRKIVHHPPKRAKSA